MRQHLHLIIPLPSVWECLACNTACDLAMPPSVQQSPSLGPLGTIVAYGSCPTALAVMIWALWGYKARQKRIQVLQRRQGSQWLCCEVWREDPAVARPPPTRASLS